jgi:hypothetical protein
MGLFRFPRIGEWVLIGQVGQIGYEDINVNGGEKATHVTAPTGEWVLLSYFPQAEEGDAGKNTPFYPKRAKQRAKAGDQLNPDDGEPNSGFFADQLNPATMGEFLDDNGMAIRYLAEKNKNKDATNTVNDGAWSEIGFYNKKAKWPDSLKTLDKTNKDKSLESSQFSRQDIINIKSTGDIESRAENYHLIKAKRFELLANAEELSPEIRAHNDRDNWSEWKPAYAPIGDHPTDDPAIHNGDVHIRAGKRVVIKADSEIRLQVGRTVLVIDDSGFSVTTRKVNSNVAISQDTSLSLKARGGINMFGETVNIASSRKFSISDAWGGGLASVVGMANLSGIQINQKTYGEAQQRVTALTNDLTLAQDLMVGSLAIDNPEQVWATGLVKYGFDVAKIIYNTYRSIDLRRDAFKNIMNHQKMAEEDEEKARATYVENYHREMINAINTADNQNKDVEEREEAAEWLRLQLELVNSNHEMYPEPLKGKVFDDAANLVGLEPIETAVAILDMILDIADAVYLGVEKGFACAWRTNLKENLKDPNYSKKISGAQKKKTTDIINLVATDIDNGIIEIFLGFIISLGIKGTGSGGPASIRLQNSGDIIIKAGSQKKLYAEASEHISVPVNITVEKIQMGLKTASAVAKLGADLAKLSAQGMNMKKLAIPPNVEKL